MAGSKQRNGNGTQPPVQPPPNLPRQPISEIPPQTLERIQQLIGGMDNAGLLDFAGKMCQSYGISSRSGLEVQLWPLADALKVRIDASTKKPLLDILFPGQPVRSVVSQTGDPTSGYDPTMSMRVLGDEEIRNRVMLLRPFIEQMRADPKRFYPTAKSNFTETQGILEQYYSKEQLEQLRVNILMKCNNNEPLSPIEELVNVMIALKPQMDNPPSMDSAPSSPPVPQQPAISLPQSQIPTPSLPQQRVVPRFSSPPRQPPMENRGTGFFGKPFVWTIASAAALSCAIHLTGSFHDMTSGLRRVLEDFLQLPSLGLTAKSVMMGFYGILAGGIAVFEIFGRKKAGGTGQQLAAPLLGQENAVGREPQLAAPLVGQRNAAWRGPQFAEPQFVQSDNSGKREYSRQRLAQIGGSSQDPQAQARGIKEAMVADEKLFDSIDTLFYTDSNEMSIILRDTGIRSEVVGVFDQLLSRAESDIMMKRYGLLASLAQEVGQRRGALMHNYQQDALFRRKLDELFENPAKELKLRHSVVSFRSASGEARISGEDFYTMLKDDYQHMKGMVGR